MTSSLSWCSVIMKKEYQNWLAVGRSLVLMCKGIRPHMEREMKAFHARLISNLASAPPCTCAGKHKTCAWAFELRQSYRHSKNPKWQQSDSTKWTDPHEGYWEVAKLYMSDLGKDAGKVVDAKNTDTSGLINLMYWCTHFKVNPLLVECVRDLRNTWSHAASHELNDADKADAFKAIEDLLQDPALAADPEVRDALEEIRRTKTCFDVSCNERQVLLEAINSFDSEISDLGKRINDLENRSKRQSQKNVEIEKTFFKHTKSESSKNKIQSQRTLKMSKKFDGLRRKLQSESCKRQELQDRLRTLENGRSSDFRLPLLFSLLVGFLLKMFLTGLTRKSARRILDVFILVGCCFVLLDYGTYKDGCPSEESTSFVDSREFNFTFDLNIARGGFVRRHWLAAEIEEVFQKSTKTLGASVVVLSGAPGMGKSAFAAQLICSLSLSPNIYTNILGYHLCKSLRKGTQDPGKFVRNLVDMIARRVPEYGNVIATNGLISRTLERDCKSDPHSCFENCITRPLQLLEFRRNIPFFIVIDGLDECMTRETVFGGIPELLKENIPNLPSWIKFIITSRNNSDIIRRFSWLDLSNVVNLKPTDPRNLEDIDEYFETRFQTDGNSREDESSCEGEDFMSYAKGQSRGNFLVADMIMRHPLWICNATVREGKSKWNIFDDIFDKFFRRTHGTVQDFVPVRSILEILVSKFIPMSPKEIFEVLHLREENLDYNYEFLPKLKTLSEYVQYDEDNTIALFHLSLLEWLTDEDRTSESPYFVNKRHGHQLLADYYLNDVKKSHSANISQQIFYLAKHIAFSGKTDQYSEDFGSIPSERVNSTMNETSCTLLHLAAGEENADILRLILPHFSVIDSEDKTNGFTPAFIASVRGFLENLELLISNESDINQKTYPPPWPPALVSPDPVRASKMAFWNSTMLHAAAQGGHKKVVTFLMERNASVLATNGINSTAIQLAAEAGHLDIVEMLYSKGALLDGLSLFNAAANGHACVVKFLLAHGIVDKCIQCNASFFWLQGRQRYQTLSLDESELEVDESSPSLSTGTSGINDWKIDFMGKKGKTIPMSVLVDDKRFLFCQTALHVAVSRGHLKVVESLLSQTETGIPCSDHSGRTPLHEAIKRNNEEIVKHLLRAGSKLTAKCKTPQSLKKFINMDLSSIIRKYSMLNSHEQSQYDSDLCPCGSSPFHLAARYGLKEMAGLIISNGASTLEINCEGYYAIHTAACHGRQDFIAWMLSFGLVKDINKKSENGSTPLHSAAICGQSGMIHFLVEKGADFTVVDKNGLTAAHYAVLQDDDRKIDIKVVVSNHSSSDGEHFDISYIRSKDGVTTHELSGIIRQPVVDQHCQALKDTIDFQPALINQRDFRGNTLLHIAGKNGLECAVQFLLDAGAIVDDVNLDSKSPLDLAIENSRVLKFEGFGTQGFVNLQYFKSQLLMNIRDQTAVVMRMLSTEYGVKFASGKCDRRIVNLINKAIDSRKPYDLYFLLQRAWHIGQDFQCTDSSGRTPLSAYLQTEERIVGDVLTMFDISFRKIRCDVPFMKSEFHLIAYRKRATQQDKYLHQFVQAMKAHPLGLGIMNQCRDQEGYSAFHRAIQGGNMATMKFLLRKGTDVTSMAPNNCSPLMLAIMFTGRHPLPSSEDRHLASSVSGMMLEYLLRTGKFDVGCHASGPGLTVYHLAAYRGLVDFVKKLLRLQPTGFDVSCPDKNGVTPLYLAKLNEGSVTSKTKEDPWKKVVLLIKSYTGTLRYPPRQVEYHVLYRLLYGTFQKPFRLTFPENVRRFLKKKTMQECQQYGNRKIDVYGFLLHLQSHVDAQTPKEVLDGFSSLFRQLDFVHESPIAATKNETWTPKESSWEFGTFDSRMRKLWENRNWESVKSAHELWCVHQQIWKKIASYDSFIVRLSNFTSKYSKFLGDAASLKKQLSDVKLFVNCLNRAWVVRVSFSLHTLASSLNDAWSFGRFRTKGAFSSIRIPWEWEVGSDHQNELTWTEPLKFLLKQALGQTAGFHYLDMLTLGVDNKTRIPLVDVEFGQLMEESVEPNKAKEPLFHGTSSRVCNVVKCFPQFPPL